MTSIYCPHVDGECFELGKCYKCKYKPAEMIDERICIRIEEDARLAIDALLSIVNCSPYLHQNYLKEKLSVVERCTKFMKNFVKDGDTNG